MFTVCSCAYCHLGLDVWLDTTQLTAMSSVLAFAGILYQQKLQSIQELDDHPKLVTWCVHNDGVRA